MSAVAAVEHGADCGCVRCTGFTVGNQLSRTHGAYSTLATSKRAEALAGEIRATMPLYSAADEPAIRLLAVTLARVERAAAALDEVDEHLGEKRLAAFMAEGQERLDRLRRDLRAWIGTANRLMSELGMTPSSRARLGLDLALAQRASDAALERLVEEGRRIREQREEIE